MPWRRSNQVNFSNLFILFYYYFDCLDTLLVRFYLNPPYFLILAELMVLGFISLLLTFGSSYILKICIPSHVAHTMLPCPAPAPPHKKEEDDKGEGHRKLLWFEHRFLSETSSTKCKEVRVVIFTVVIKMKQTIPCN